MLRPYVIDRDLPNLPNLHDLLRLLRSVSGILLQQRVRVHLVLRNRQQHAERRTRRLVPPRLGVLAVPDQILAPLGFAGELEPALLEDKVVSNGPRERRRDGFFGTRAQLIQQRQGRRIPRRQLVPRLRLRTIGIAQAEPGVIVAVVLGHVFRIGRPLVEPRAFAFGGLRLISDVDGEDQRVAGPVLGRKAGLYVVLRSVQDDLPARGGRIERRV